MRILRSEREALSCRFLNVRTVLKRLGMRYDMCCYNSERNQEAVIEEKKKQEKLCGRLDEVYEREYQVIIEDAGENPAEIQNIFICRSCPYWQKEN